MGTRSRNLAIVVAVAALGLALTASASPTPPRLADARKNATPVDVELVIAVDVSYSMDPDEQALQREGYISGALQFAKPLFDDSGHKGLRRVIDVSGDGTNNAGQLIVPTRDEVLAAGITINGLPIMLKRPYVGTLDIDELDVYYEDCVIGGPGAFVVPIREREKFIEATRTKLVLEIAGRQPEGRIIPASSQAPRVSCTIGEKMWQERWGGGIDFR